MSETLKEKFLSSSFLYQGKAVTFEDIKNAIGFGAFESLTSTEIIKILSGEILVFGAELERSVDFYFARKFIHEDTNLIDFEYEFGHDYILNLTSYLEHCENRTAAITFRNFHTEFIEKKFETQFDILRKVKENIVFKRTYLDLNNDTYQYLHKNSSELIEQAEKEKILILSSEAGSGKTVSFEKLAIEIKATNPNRHVSYVDLKDHVKDYISNITIENVQLTVEKILGIGEETKKFEKSLFRESYKSDNVVILWNGYDEISPTYSESIINIIDSIHNSTKNIQYVCTRPLYSDQLSWKFKIRPWQLVPFNDDGKINFLRKYFESKNITSDKTDENIQKIEEIMEKFGSKSEYIYSINTPLMLKLLAEIHEDKENFNAESVYEIYNIFVWKKIQDFGTRSSQGQDSVAKIISNPKINIIKIFQKYALINIINLFSASSAGIKMIKLQIMQRKIPPELPFEEISRMGILYINSETEFKFAHRTFSEFFIAQYLIDSFYSPEEAIALNDGEIEVQIEMFFHLMNRFIIDLQIITDFLISYLKSRAENKTRRKFHPRISYILRTKFRDYFMTFIGTEDFKFFEFLIEFVKNDHDLLVELLHLNDDTTFYTAIFNPKSFSSLNPKEILDLAKNCLNDDELKMFVEGRNEKGKILLGMYIYKLIGKPKLHYNNEYNLEIEKLNGTSFWEIYDKIKGNLTIDEEKGLFLSAINLRIYANFKDKFSHFNFSEYEKLWSNFEILLTKSEMKKAFGTLIIDYFNINSEDKTGYALYLYFFFSKIEKFLNDSEIYEMFLNENILNDNNCKGNDFSIIWNFLKNHTNVEQRRQILLQDNGKNITRFKSYHNKKGWIFYNYYNNPFRILINSVNSDEQDSFEFVKKIYKEHIPNKSQIQIIFQDSSDFLFYIVGLLDKNSFKKVFSFFVDYYEGNEKALRKFILQKVEPTNLSIFQLFEKFKDIYFAPAIWFNKVKILKTFTDEYN